ncbi:hypothetical protein F5X68DRAFT_214091 [Plectosphaerella plurivora]|uniref:Secreted protein n=1 Tax=Plectosphaerella plurivora TaxID=936078 RepID=A0A9P9A7I7_9PEZI|nr:hypothetical protein F5X68DRAFT_214091 [Plectosphaerella plurivora]
MRERQLKWSIVQVWLHCTRLCLARPWTRGRPEGGECSWLNLAVAHNTSLPPLPLLPLIREEGLLATSLARKQS